MDEMQDFQDAVLPMEGVHKTRSNQSDLTEGIGSCLNGQSRHLHTEVGREKPTCGRPSMCFRTFSLPTASGGRHRVVSGHFLSSTAVAVAGKGLAGALARMAGALRKQDRLSTVRNEGATESSGTGGFGTGKKLGLYKCHISQEVDGTPIEIHAHPTHIHDHDGAMRKPVRCVQTRRGEKSFGWDGA